MITRDILGNELWECTPDEARRIWLEQPAEQWRITTQEELASHVLDGVGELEAWVAKKKERPGKHLGLHIPFSGDPATLPTYCTANGEWWCTARPECEGRMMHCRN